MFLNLEWPAIGALQLRWLLRPRRVCLNLGLGSGRGYTARISTKTRFNNIFRLVTASPARAYRSEEHTSELQSLMRISYAVFCLQKNNTKKHKQLALNK